MIIMPKKKSTENVINLDNILFNCRDILRADNEKLINSHLV